MFASFRSIRLISSLSCTSTTCYSKFNFSSASSSTTKSLNYMAIVQHLQSISNYDDITRYMTAGLLLENQATTMIEDKDKEMSIRLQDKDKEMSNRLQDKDKEFGNRLQDKDKEISNRLQDKEQFYQREIENLHDRHNAFVALITCSYTKRYALERFFRAVFNIIHEKADLREELSIIVDPLIIKLIKSKQPPTMTQMNVALQHHHFRKLVFKHLNMNQDTPIPKFQDELLYGKLSDIVHHSPYQIIYLPSNAFNHEIEFFNNIASVIDMEVRIFNVLLALDETKIRQLFHKTPTK